MKDILRISRRFQAAGADLGEGAVLNRLRTSKLHSVPSLSNLDKWALRNIRTFEPTLHTLIVFRVPRIAKCRPVSLSCCCLEPNIFTSLIHQAFIARKHGAQQCHGFCESEYECPKSREPAPKERVLGRAAVKEDDRDEMVLWSVDRYHGTSRERQ